MDPFKSNPKQPKNKSSKSLNLPGGWYFVFLLFNWTHICVHTARHPQIVLKVKKSYRLKINDEKWKILD